MISVSDLKNKIKNADFAELEEIISLYESETKAGIKSEIEKAKKKIEKYNAELKRLYILREYERKYEDAQYICGIDEVGRGPLAGPVMAGAVILPKDCNILYVNDSKKLSEAKREELNLEIREKALSYCIGVNDHKRIDEINILQATYEAMRQAIAGLNFVPDVLLNDAVTIPLVNIEQCPIIKGDAKSISIACASIIAKVERDHFMEKMENIYPGYGFASNKGYGSSAHIEAIKTLGPCEIHRRSFIKNFL